MIPRVLPGLLGALMIAGTAIAPASAAESVTTHDGRVAVGAEPGGAKVDLDTTVFTPSKAGRHTAVVLAHGFGGDKTDVADDARRLAEKGYVVLTFSARGFGASGGKVHLTDPAYEIKDVSHLIDSLATRSDVKLDAAGDPHVAVIGGSYGGAQALMSASLDRRVDADGALITYHDLDTAFFSQSAVGVNEPGPFKQVWGSRFFAGSLTGDNLCGRFAPAICGPFRHAGETGQATSALRRTLRAHSPAPYLNRLRVPTLILQGETDSLFGLDQADATVRTLAKQGTPLTVRWSSAGHDAGGVDNETDRAAVSDWLTRVLPPDGGPGSSAAGFTFAVPRQADSRLPAYPGTGGQRALATTRIPLEQDGGRVVNPPGGKPSSISAVPGADTSGLPVYRFAALPGQSVTFDTRRIDDDVVLAGAPRVRLRIRSTGRRVTLFASLWRVDSTGEVTQQHPLVAPLSAPVSPNRATDVTVNLPMNTYRMRAGSSWRVLITSTDSAFATPTATRVDHITLADEAITAPVLPPSVAPVPSAFDGESRWLVAALAVMLLGAAGYAWWNRARHPHPVDPDLADVPLAVNHLVKTYRDGHRAVDDVSWRAERGQVIGLLGPNGAGKTTTMRMLLGLIRPDSGTVHVLGRPVYPGAPVLDRVGALVEGPGFLPHLSGRENLEAYWRATGRPRQEASFEDAIEVAALGGALDRPVRTYSQGMRQRLGIAQAMLGKPELLFLDEPTNGLDPPQIAAMRPILAAYAATGRTVVVSSHLLGEVEQTCTHVVVMHAGRVVTSGTVADMVSDADTTVLTLAGDAPLSQAAATMRRLPGVRDVEALSDPPRLVVAADRPRAEVVRDAVQAGLAVVEVGARRHLEEVFLGVIASAQGDGPAEGGTGSLTDRLRQVRSR